MKGSRWGRLIRRAAMAAALAFFIAVAPLPAWTPNWFLYWQVPATVFVLIAYIGKLLIDTIVFPDRD